MEAPRLRFIVRGREDIAYVPALNGWKKCKPNSVVDIEFHSSIPAGDRIHISEVFSSDERVYVRHFDKPSKGYSLGILCLSVLAGSSIAGFVGYTCCQGEMEPTHRLELAHRLLQCGITGAAMGLAIKAINEAKEINWRTWWPFKRDATGEGTAPGSGERTAPGSGERTAPESGERTAPGSEDPAEVQDTSRGGLPIITHV